MGKIYIVNLKESEKEQLIELTQKGRAGARKIKRAQILLLANKGKSDAEIAELLETSVPTVVRTRHKFVNGNLSFALNEQARSGRTLKVTDKVEAIITTLAQSVPPAGRKHWSLQMLADRLITLKVIETISDEAVRLVLKKTI
jgi:transposase